ncbi:MAG: hypothetical protein FRX48_05269 [Lasallia pustulata]|uniref:Rhodopsin domain-containing protein n=1 Tax=Lasallia pustulata TaxID=136370 RepID=A0A5M8PQJ6_9LECA|nr:MAG: hypothetical protein FRX48_05269 [Lasallia pustulata]
MASIPAAILEGPAMPPPPGVNPNFVDPHSQGPTLIIGGSIMITLMTLFVLARGYTKYHIIRKASWDDVTCVIAAVGAVAYFVICIYAVRGKMGTHQWNVRYADLISDRLVIPTYLVGVVVPFILFFAKLSFFLLYLQLFRPIKALRLCIYAGAVFTGLLYISCIVVFLAYQTPHPGQSFQAFQSRAVIKKAQIVCTVLGVTGTVIDLYILVLPIAAISQLQLEKRRKIGVILVFMTGTIAVFASTMSLYYRVLLDRTPDFTWYLFPAVNFALVEICVGVICSCMPCVSCMLRHHLPPYEKMKSLLYSRLSFVRTLVTTPGGSHYSNSKSKPNHKDQHGQWRDGSTIVLTTHKPKNSTHSNPNTDHMGDVKTTHTYIDGGKNDQDGQVGGRGIHLRYDLQQSWFDASRSANSSMRDSQLSPV